MSDIWIVIIEDRHSDVDVKPYADEQEAIRRAEQVARDYASHPESIDMEYELTRPMIEAGWVRCIPYSVEGDCVRVVRRSIT